MSIAERPPQSHEIPNDDHVAKVSAELQCVGRERVWHLTSRIKNYNRIVHTVANSLGYVRDKMMDKERKKIFAEAAELIKAINAQEVASSLSNMVFVTQVAIDQSDRMVKQLESAMHKLAETLPIMSWVNALEQRGFGVHRLATLIAETGDLRNYDGPYKLNRRIGCAPFTKNGETLMGSTWRKRKKVPGITKLTNKDWQEFGYSPRRRSVAYLIGEHLIRSNNDGPYRQEYLRAKVAAYVEHPDWDWKLCTKCENKARKKKGCKTCGGTGHRNIHAHNHGHLLATKLLLKNLWIAWREVSA